MEVRPFLELKKYIDAKKLNNRIIVDNKRTTFDYIDDENLKIEIAFDQVKVTVSEQILEEYEVEIESKKCNNQRFREFVNDLQKHFPDAKLVHHGKLARALFRLGYKKPAVPILDIDLK